MKEQKTVKIEGCEIHDEVLQKLETRIENQIPNQQTLLSQLLQYYADDGSMFLHFSVVINNLIEDVCADFIGVDRQNIRSVDVSVRSGNDFAVTVAYLSPIESCQKKNTR